MELGVAYQAIRNQKTRWVLGGRRSSVTLPGRWLKWRGSMREELQCDEILVQRILAGATVRRLTNIGEFGQFVRPYLTAGYLREVSEAHRRYFELIYAAQAGAT